jgi:hypothetical protein
MERDGKEVGMKKRFYLLFLVTLLAGCGVDWFPAVIGPATLTSIAVTPAAPSIVVGATQQFTATGTYSDSSTKDLTSTATWASSTQTFATITATGGLATAVAAGTTTITATSGTVSGTTQLTVTTAVVTPVVVRTISTFAGSSGAQGLTDGTGNAAQFDTPIGITSDGTNLYVADSANSVIRKIVIATAEVTTMAITPALSKPTAITTDGVNLYVTDTNSIFKVVILTGVSTQVAPLATFNAPEGITISGTSLYVANTGNNNILKIDPTSGTVTIIAGSGTVGSADNTNGLLATFSGPTGITSDGTNLYVTDTANSTIRKIVIPTVVGSSGAVTTIAGSVDLGPGTADGTGTAAQFDSPTGITVDANVPPTSLFVTDTNNGTVREIVIATNAVTTISKNTSGTLVTNGIVAKGTDLYVTDSSNFDILKLTK